jgi:hypothetical protein
MYSVVASSTYNFFARDILAHCQPNLGVQWAIYDRSL